MFRSHLWVNLCNQRGVIVKVFIWERVDKCSDNYHPEGGVVVFARSEYRARSLANDIPGCNISDDEKPDHVRETSGGDEAVFIFPDAGCC